MSQHMAHGTEDIATSISHTFVALFESIYSSHFIVCERALESANFKNSSNPILNWRFQICLRVHLLFVFSLRHRICLE